MFSYLISSPLLSKPENKENIIQGIEIRGAVGLSKKQIRELFSVREGDLLDKEKINAGLKRIFQTARFRQVEILKEAVSQGINLKINLTSFPIIENIKFVGDHFTEAQKNYIREKFESTSLRKNTRAEVIQLSKQLLEDDSWLEPEVDLKIENKSTAHRTLILKTSSTGKYRIDKIYFKGITNREKKYFKKKLELKEGIILTDYFSHPAYKRDIDRIESYFRKRGFLDAKVNLNRKGWKIQKREYLPISAIRVDFILEKGNPYFYHSFSIRTKPEKKILYETISRNKNPLKTRFFPEILNTLLEVKIFDRPYRTGEILPGPYVEKLEEELKNLLWKDGNLLSEVSYREKVFNPDKSFFSHFENCKKIKISNRRKKCLTKKEKWNLNFLRNAVRKNPELSFQKIHHVQFLVREYSVSIIENILYPGFSEKQEEEARSLLDKFKGQEANSDFWRQLESIKKNKINGREVKFIFRRGSQKKFAYVILKLI